MDILDSALLGVVQGITEFLPISSSGHLILAREFLGISDDGGGLAFDAILHFATALAVLVYFFGDIWNLIKSAVMWVSSQHAEEGHKHLIVALVVATIPAVILGLLLEEIMATLFRNPVLVVGTLLLGSLIMFIAEKKLSQEPVKAESLSMKNALLVGLFQSLALVPGMSRSGMAISGGMILGLSREEAARFAFLLAVPLLLGAGAKKFLDLSQSGALEANLAPLILGAIVAFGVGIAAIHFMLSFLRKRSLMPFIYYRVALALAVLVFLTV